MLLNASTVITEVSRGLLCPEADIRRLPDGCPSCIVWRIALGQTSASLKSIRLRTGVLPRCLGPMCLVLEDDPAHHRPIPPTLYIGSESIRGYQVAIDSHLLWPRERSEEAGHG